MENNEKNLEMVASSSFNRDLNTIPSCSNWVRRNCSTRNVAIRCRRRSLPFTPKSRKLLCLLETAPQTVPSSKSSRIVIPLNHNTFTDHKTLQYFSRSSICLLFT